MYAANGNIEKTVGYGYTYGDATKGEIPDTVYKVTYDGKDFLSYTYDSLGRLSQRKVGATSEKYTYKNNADGTTTPRVDVYTTIAGLDISYEYDANGNITHISGEADENYTYDSQNRLIRMDHQYMGITETYDYDDRGNILSRKRYDYTTGDINYQPIETINYGYTDATWADLMTEYNGQSISYDSLGNPLAYRDGMSMTWTMGRRLSTLTKDEFTNTYTYNADGLRMSKTTSEGTTTYFIIDGEYVGEETYIDGVRHVTMYLYDDKGTVVGINADGEVYYMVKNAQGDVTGLVDKNGSRAAYYDYDPWGAPDGCYDGNGNYITAKDHIAYRNPFRYRGYMYDAETGLYYISSRYYDPEISRFIGADTTDILEAKGDLYDKNLFAYCDNNPITRADNGGDFWHIAIGAVVGGLIGGAVKAAFNVIEGKDITDGLCTAILSGAASGALASTGVGLAGMVAGNAAISMAENATNQVIANNGFDNFDVEDMLIDGVIGGVSGAIGGKGTGSKHLTNLGKQTVKRTFNATANKGLKAGIKEAGKAFVYYGKNTAKYYRSYIKGLPKDLLSTIGTNIVSSNYMKYQYRRWKGR